MSENREAKNIPEDALAGDETNGLSRDILFSLEQANLAKKLLQDVNQSRNIHIEAQSKWEAFLIGVGMSNGDEIVGGDLDSDDPSRRCLTVRTSNGIAKG